MIPNVNGQGFDEAGEPGDWAGEPQPVPEDDLGRRFDELSKVIRDHLAGLGR